MAWPESDASTSIGTKQESLEARVHGRKSAPGDVSNVLRFEIERPGKHDGEGQMLLSTNATSDGVTSNGHATGHGAHGGEKCGVFKTLANIFISFIGAGILGLPSAFKRSGIVLGASFMICLALLAYYCILLLVACKKQVEHKGVVTYSEVAEAALGQQGKMTVEVLLVVSQMSFCAAYLIFIYTNLPPLVPLSHVSIVLLITPLQVAMSMLRDLSALAPFSLLADCAHVVGMVVVLKDDVENFTAHETVVASKGISAVPFLFGVVIYCYEGIGMILPVEHSMQDKSKFRMTITIGFSIITSIFLVFGLVGYAAFGEHTADTITENLPPGATTYSVKIALCLALFFTFPIMMVPVYEIIERSVEALPWVNRSVPPNRRELMFRVIRTLVVSLTGVIAVSVPGFSIFISFVGSLCCGSLAFIIPAACHLVLFAHKITTWETCMDYFLILFGFTGMVFGVGQALHGAITGEGVHH